MTSLGRLATGVVVAILTLGPTACSDDEPSGRDALVAKIKSDPGTAGMPDKAVDCLANWYLTYASEQERTAFLNGSTGNRGLDQVAGSPEARTAILDCLKTAAENQ